jgi:ribosomal protein S18 acetylase RimI-like enzyme
MTAITIRPGTPADADAVDAACRATADGGRPQRVDVVDPALVSLVYARPYLELEPATSRLLVRDGSVSGYVVGALDSPAFYRRAGEWAAAHLPRPPGADPDLVALLTEPERALPSEVEDFPSHLHVNLLPAARGAGLGRRLVSAFLTGLVQAGSPGVHLRVDRANRRAVGFYARLGFTTLHEGETLTMARTLPPAQ